MSTSHLLFSSPCLQLNSLISCDNFIVCVCLQCECASGEDVSRSDCGWKVGCKQDHTEIICQLLPGQGANNSVMVVVGGAESTNNVAPIFSYDAPVVERVLVGTQDVPPSYIVRVEVNNETLHPGGANTGKIEVRQKKKDATFEEVANPATYYTGIHSHLLRRTVYIYIHISFYQSITVTKFHFFFCLRLSQGVW
jgi:hypothetical protein